MTFGTNEDKTCFSVGILDDSLSEGPENFIARILPQPNVFDIGSPDASIISIADDESKATVQRNCVISKLHSIFSSFS